MDCAELAEYPSYIHWTVHSLINEEGLSATRRRGEFKNSIADRWLEGRMLNILGTKEAGK